MVRTRLTKVCVGIVFVMLFVGTAVRAEGFIWSKDRKRLLEPHSWLELTEKQEQEIKWRSVITLTPKQLEKLRKIEPTAHNKVENMSSDWDMCTCCVGQCIVVFPSGRVAVPHGYLGRPLVLVDEGLPMRGKIGPILKVGINSDGKFYNDDKEISFSEMCSGQPVIIECSEKIDNDEIEKTVAQTVQKLELWAEEHDVEVVMTSIGAP